MNWRIDSINPSSQEQDHIFGWLNRLQRGAVAQPTAREFDTALAHLRTCAECRQTLGLLAEVWPDRAPLHTLWAHVMPADAPEAAPSDDDLTDYDAWLDYGTAADPAPPNAATIAAHVRDCPHCAATIAELRTLMVAGMEAVAQQSAPDGVQPVVHVPPPTWRAEPIVVVMRKLAVGVRAHSPAQRVQTTQQNYQWLAAPGTPASVEMSSKVVATLELRDDDPAGGGWEIDLTFVARPRMCGGELRLKRLAPDGTLTPTSGIPWHLEHRADDGSWQSVGEPAPTDADGAGHFIIYPAQKYQMTLDMPGGSWVIPITTEPDLVVNPPPKG